jgi:chemotaxis protein CheD
MTEEKQVESIYLYPAALEVSKGTGIIHTILGSCVAVCLFDKQKSQGGINHYMLPLWNGVGLATPKYGNIAIERLLNDLIALGSRKENLVAKIFGGGEVIEVKNQSFNIGRKNIEIAFEILTELKIPIVAQSVGGNLGRKIVFNSRTGEVIQRFVKPKANL